MSLGTGVHIGLDTMGASEVEHAQQLREDQHTQHQRNTELAAANRLETLLEPAGALHLPLVRAGGCSMGAVQNDSGCMQQGC